ncbi:DUF1302 domain-containing protein [Stagnimonas aquatica]|nr:DUF1302 family protein [Stagnimonas aquatica]
MIQHDIGTTARRAAWLLAMLAASAPARALEGAWDLGGDSLRAVLNTGLQLGAQWRVEARADDLVGKANLNPELCPLAPNGAGTSCIAHLSQADPSHAPGALNLNSYVGEGPASNQAAIDAPGQFSSNADDGNLNFEPGDLTQALARLNSDLTLSWGEFTLFARGNAYFDPVNEGRAVWHPNAGSQAYVERTGLRRGARGDALKIAASPAADRQLGLDARLLDLNLSTRLPLPGDRELGIQLGRQSINWGESTLLIVNSLNTFSPPNVNALYRPGALELSEVLPPVDALRLSLALSEPLTLEAFYQYRWQPVEIAPPGSYFSTVDVGSGNAADRFYLGFGKVAENPERVAIADELMLSALTDSDGTPSLLPEHRARDGGQFGVSLQYYAEWLGSGTTLAFYAGRYHSRLPYLSFYAGDYGCASGPNAPTPAAEGPGKYLADMVALLAACPGADAPLVLESALPVGLAPAVRDQRIGTNGNALPIDTIRARLEYPEDIALYGFSFNTTVGEMSIQGEIAYRPQAPLQVDDTDLGFAALQSSFPRGSGSGGADDRFDVGLPGIGVVAQLPGARRAIPDFVSAYRGKDPLSYQPGEYIRGWETFATAQYNLGATWVFGPANPFGADQILAIGEWGATQVFGLPSLDRLQIEGPGTFTHASAGVDGSGADGSARANSGLLGSDGLRFNPQQQRDGFADAFAWGYRLIGLFRYESVWPGVSLAPSLVWMHDVQGTAPGPGENFVAGRKNLIATVETRFGASWSWTLGYSAFFGGGAYNLLRDRDCVQTGLRWTF